MNYQKTKTKKEMIEEFCYNMDIPKTEIEDAYKGSVKNSIVIATKEFKYYRHYDTNVVTVKRGDTELQIDFRNMSPTTAKFFNKFICEELVITATIFRKDYRYYLSCYNEAGEKVIIGRHGRIMVFERCVTDCGRMTIKEQRDFPKVY